jgi:hypothetical protein
MLPDLPGLAIQPLFGSKPKLSANASSVKNGQTVDLENAGLWKSNLPEIVCSKGD